MQRAFGVDIGGTKIRAAIVSADGQIAAFCVVPTPKTAEHVAAAIDAMITGLDDGTAAAIGIGVPGRVDAAAGKIFSGGFVDLSGMSFAASLTQAKSRRVVIGNDAAMALVAEARVGAAKGLAHVVLLTIGTGIGGAIMMGGRIMHGRATAGQLGHMTVDINGLPCLCGRRGCLETTSSGTALGRLISAAGLPPATTAGDLLRREDETAKTILRDWVQPLRAGIDSLVAAFDPQRVVLGGGLGAAAARALAEFPAVSPWYQCEVVAASLDDDAGVIGAALASLEPPP